MNFVMVLGKGALYCLSTYVTAKQLTEEIIAKNALPNTVRNMTSCIQQTLNLTY